MTICTSVWHLAPVSYSSEHRPVRLTIIMHMQVVNLHTNKVSRILGKVENNERFLRIALYQGDKGNKKVRKIPALAANVNDTKEPLSDPTLLCCAFKKHRIYTFRYASSSIRGECFIGWCQWHPLLNFVHVCYFLEVWRPASSLLLYSRREPEEPEDATKGRDVFNEKPPPEELLSVSELGKTATTSLPDNLVCFLNNYICLLLLWWMILISKLYVKWISHFLHCLNL